MNEHSKKVNTATQWLRWSRMEVAYPRDDNPSFAFQEDKTTVVGANKTDTYLGHLSVAYDPSYTFAIVDSTTGLPTESTMTLQDLLLHMESLYRHLATLRGSV